MTDEQRAALLALAERCEATTGPDSKLERDIAFAIMPDSPKKNRQVRGIEYAPPAAPFTASIDAALTLVPDPKFYVLDERPKSDGRHTVTAWVGWWTNSETWAKTDTVEAAMPALALCAAALRARAAQ